MSATRSSPNKVVVPAATTVVAANLLCFLSMEICHVMVAGLQHVSGSSMCKVSCHCRLRLALTNDFDGHAKCPTSPRP